VQGVDPRIPTDKGEMVGSRYHVPAEPTGRCRVPDRGNRAIPRQFASSWAIAVRDNIAGHSGHAAESVRGVSLSAGDLMLSAVTAPTTVGVKRLLSFRIQTVAGVPVTNFDTENTKQLRLIVVRGDGTEFRHVHPTMNAEGQWSIPWAWGDAGPYRIFADFVPATGMLNGKNTVLSDTIDVGGAVTPHRPWTPSPISRVDGFTVTIDSNLTAGAASTLTATITHDGRPVTHVRPYLGNYRHLVILREGDLAYLHAHPLGGPGPSEAGSLSGPRISFVAEPPTPGRYRLYLDFQVDGHLHTAQFAVDAQGNH
jgi:hypothetical protein